MEERTITVTGHGGVHVVPDVTRVKLEIGGLRAEYSDCYELAKENNTQLTMIMSELGLDKKLPKTTNLNINRHQNSIYRNDHYETEYDGYQLNQTVKIDIGMDNELLGRLVRAIGCQMIDVEIQIGYTVKDPRQAQLRMLERAVKDAREKAGIMASAADCRLGEVRSINYSWSELEIYSQARNIGSCEEAAVCCSESLDITPDDLAVSDNVTVIWRLESDGNNL